MRYPLIMLAALAAAALLPLPSHGQTGRDAAISRILDDARAAEVDIIMLDAPDPPPAGAAAPSSPSESVLHLVDGISANLKQAVTDIAAAPETLPAAVADVAPDGDTGWLWWTVVVTLVAVLAGWGVERALSQTFAPAFPAPPPADAPRARRIRATMARTAMEGVLIAIGAWSGPLGPDKIRRRL